MRAEERIAELEFLAAYLSHGRLTHTIERNVLLVESFAAKKSAKPDDFVRLYDNLVHNASDILALPGVSDDAQVANQAEAQLSLFRAHRCFHLARCYLAAGMHGAASQLFERATFYATPLSASETLAAEAARIVQEAAGLRVRARAQLYLREAGAAAQLASLNMHHGTGARRKRTLCENLDEFASFVNDPAALRPHRGGARPHSRLCRASRCCSTLPWTASLSRTMNRQRIRLTVLRRRKQKRAQKMCPRKHLRVRSVHVSGAGGLVRARFCNVVRCDVAVDTGWEDLGGRCLRSWYGA